MSHSLAMRALPTAVAVTAAVLCTATLAGGQTPAPDAANPGQAFFRDAILKDSRTTPAIRRALERDAAVVDPATQYAELTGDDRSDAIVRVHSAGSAGVIALYVFSTAGAGEVLRVVYRSQSLYRAVTRATDDDRLQIDEPVYGAGDLLCCPDKLKRRRYRYSKARGTFLRSSLETVDAR